MACAATRAGGHRAEPAAAVEQATHPEDAGEGDGEQPDLRREHERAPRRRSSLVRSLIRRSHGTTVGVLRRTWSFHVDANGLSRVTRSAGIAGGGTDRRARIPRRAIDVHDGERAVAAAQVERGPEVVARHLGHDDDQRPAGGVAAEHLDRAAQAAGRARRARSRGAP